MLRNTSVGRRRTADEGINEKDERRELLDAVADAGRLARGSGPAARVHGARRPAGPARRRGYLPSSAAISRALRLRSSILSTVFLSCLVSLPYDLPDGFGLDMSASLHRGPGDSGPSGVAYPDSRLRTQRNENENQGTNLSHRQSCCLIIELTIASNIMVAVAIGGAMARGGRGNRGKFSANTKSFVSGKISGQYRAKGYSRAHSQHIGNAVVGKMHGTFKSGRGSKKSYGKGFKVGYGRSSWHYGSFSGSPTGASLGLSKQASSENPGHEHPRTQPYDKRYSMNSNYGKNYGKRYR